MLNHGHSLGHSPSKRSKQNQKRKSKCDSAKFESLLSRTKENLLKVSNGLK